MKSTLANKTTPAPRRVLIVDDHPFLRMGLSAALSLESDICVCGAVATAEEALTVVGNLRPDLVLTDLSLPGKSGLDLIKDLITLYPGLPVIALSMHEEDIYAERCLRAGARGYLMKSEAPEKLAAVIRYVLADGIHVSEKTTARIVAAFSGRPTRNEQPALSHLTDREFELFQWIGRGLSTSKIAERMHISAKTVETHRMNIKEKLGLATAGELISFASR